MRVRFEGSHVRSRTVETYGYRVEYTVHDRRLQWLALVEGQGRIWVFKGQFYVPDALAGTITHHPIDTVTDRIRHEIDAITRECRHSVMSCNFCGLVRVNDRMPGAPTDRDTDHRSADRVRMRAVIREGQELRRRACSLRLASTGAVDRLLHLQSEIHQDRSRSIRLSEP